MTSDRTDQLAALLPDWLSLDAAARRRAAEVAQAAPRMDAATRAAVALLVRPVAPNSDRRGSADAVSGQPWGTRPRRAGRTRAA